MKTAIDKYLNHYGEPEAKSVAQLTSSIFDNQAPYQHCLVIPAFNESPDFLQRFSRHPQAASTLLIVVVNQPDSCPQEDSNLALWNYMHAARSEAEIDKSIDGRIAFIRSGELNILAIDRFSGANKIPKKQGVGLARKIACDVACQLYQQGRLTSSWIHSTDADAHLPDNYFSSSDRDASAKVFNFRHLDDHGAIAAATQVYEQSIKYYRDSLAWAGSPYAFYTLGSTLAVKADAYCKVRGFPKRAGGEDFYFLNKVAKVGRVISEDKIIIDISARLSDRVPFGTGPGVKKLLALKEQGLEYHYYRFTTFVQLKHCLEWVENILPEYFFASAQAKVYAGLDSQEIQSALHELDFRQFTHHARGHCRDQQAIIRHFHHWFDAFKTLKFIHHMRDKFFPNTALAQCLDDARENAEQ